MTKILLLSFTLIFTSCSQPKKSTKKKVPGFHKYTSQEIEYIMDNQNIDCASINGQDCPSGVARLMIFAKKGGASVCSGFMVDSTTLVTNNHCVANTSECEGTHIAIYDNTTNDYTTTSCESIRATGRDSHDPNDKSKAVDFTVMNIKDIFYGSTFESSSVGARVYDRVTAWVIDHTGIDMARPNVFDSRITEFDCTVKNQSEFSSTVLINCPSINGNSGSPVLNRSGRVVGVIWGGMTSKNVDASTLLYVRRKSDLSALMTDISFFSKYL